MASNGIQCNGIHRFFFSRGPGTWTVSIRWQATNLQIQEYCQDCLFQFHWLGRFTLQVKSKLPSGCLSLMSIFEWIVLAHKCFKRMLSLNIMDLHGFSSIIHPLHEFYRPCAVVYASPSPQPRQRWTCCEVLFVLFSFSKFEHSLFIACLYFFNMLIRVSTSNFLDPLWYFYPPVGICFVVNPPFGKYIFFFLLSLSYCPGHWNEVPSSKLYQKDSNWMACHWTWPAISAVGTCWYHSWSFTAMVWTSHHLQ